MATKLTRRELLRNAALAGSVGILAACQPQVIEVTREVEKEKVVTQVVKETVVVEGQAKEVTKVVEKVVTPTIPPRKLFVDSGQLIVWDCPNSVADMPKKEAKEKAFKARCQDRVCPRWLDRRFQNEGGHPHGRW